MENKPDIQLPVEVVQFISEKIIDFTLAYCKSSNKDIANDAAEYTDDEIRRTENPLTAYATKLQVLEYDNNQLKGELEGYKKACEELQRQNDKMKAMATGWRPLLEEVLKHDAAFGELSIEMIDKIKKFLYGE